MSSPPYYEPERQAAARLPAGHPAWLITWGSWSRRYWAFRAADALKATIISATSTGGLLARMAAAELAAVTRNTPAHQHRPRHAHPVERRPGRA